MAADDETCHGNANFAIICSFISKFGEEFGLPNSMPALQRMLEDTENVDDELKEIHIKLLRKARKWFNKEKWERALVKFCHEYSSVDAWEIERFGYKKAKLSVKLELMKRLLELQFDCNAKFKGEVNKQDALSLRILPIGRDLNGHVYWYQLDKECNLRLYMQEVEDDNSWKLLCSTKEDLQTLLESLGSKVDSKEEDEAVKEEKDAVDAEKEEKCETVEEKSDESKAVETDSIEKPSIKQEVDEKSAASHSSDKECSVIKPGDAEHENANSKSSPPIIASDLSGNRIPLKDCIVNLQSDSINLKDTDEQSYVIKTTASDNKEVKANTDSIVIKRENIADDVSDQVQSVVPEVPLDRPEEVSNNVDVNENNVQQSAVGSSVEHRKAVDHCSETEKCDSVIPNKFTNAKGNDTEPKKQMHEGAVEEQQSSLLKSSKSDKIVEKHKPTKLPFVGSAAVIEAHLIKPNSAITTSLMSERVNAMFEHRNVGMDKKKQDELKMFYKSSPIVRNIPMCDEVPMDLSTTGRSRESKNESLVISRQEHEIPTNFKSESYITKIERQLTKMCGDSEGVRFRKNDKIAFSSKHQKLRKNESFKKLPAKGIDQFQLSKINIEKPNLVNQTNIPVLMGENFLTKDIAEQTRQSVICEIKNSKLISSEKNQVSSSNHHASSSLASNHSVSNATPVSVPQITEKSPDQLDKSSVIQKIGNVSSSEKTSLISPKSDSCNNIATTEKKNLGFRKCLLNEFKADRCPKLISSPDNILKDKFTEAKSTGKSILEEPKQSGKVVGREDVVPSKCKETELSHKEHNFEECKPVSQTHNKSKGAEPVSEMGKSEVTKSLKEKDLCEKAQHLHQKDKYENTKPLNEEAVGSESKSLSKEDKYIDLTESFNKATKCDALGPSSKEGKCKELESLKKGMKCKKLELSNKEVRCKEPEPLGKETKCKELVSLIEEIKYTKLEPPQTETMCKDLGVSNKEAKDQELGLSNKEANDRDLGASNKKAKNRELGLSSKEAKGRELGASIKKAKDQELGQSNTEAKDRESGASNKEAKDRELGLPDQEIKDKESGASNKKARDRVSETSNKETKGRELGLQNQETKDKESGAANKKVKYQELGLSHKEAEDREPGASNEKAKDRETGASNEKAKDRELGLPNQEMKDRESGASNKKAKDQELQLSNKEAKDKELGASNQKAKNLELQLSNKEAKDKESGASNRETKDLKLGLSNQEAKGKELGLLNKAVKAKCSELASLGKDAKYKSTEMVHKEVKPSELEVLNKEASCTETEPLNVEVKCKESEPLNAEGKGKEAEPLNTEVKCKKEGESLSTKENCETKPLRKKDKNGVTEPSRKREKNGEVDTSRKKEKNEEAELLRKMDKSGEAKTTQKMDKNEDAEPLKKMDKNEEAEPLRKMDKSGEAKTTKKMDKTEEAENIRKKDKNEEAEPLRKVDKSGEAKTTKKMDKNEEAENIRKKDKNEEAETVRKKDKNEDAETIRKKDKSEEAKTTKKMDKNEEVETIRKKDKNEEVETIRKKDKNEETKALRNKDEVEPVTKEACDDEMKPSFIENKSHVPQSLSEDMGKKVKKLVKGDKGEVNTLLHKTGILKPSSNVEDNCQKKMEHTDRKEKLLELSVQIQKFPNVSSVCDVVNSPEIEGLSSDTEIAFERKSVKSCSSSSDKEVITSEYEAKLRKSACEVDVSETKEKQNLCHGEDSGSTPENAEGGKVKHSDVGDNEKTENLRVVAEMSDAKAKDVCIDESSKMKGRKTSEKGTLNAKQTVSENAAEQQVGEINAKNETMGDKGNAKTDGTELKESLESESSARKSNKKLDPVKSRDTRTSDCEVSTSRKGIQDVISSSKLEAQHSKGNSEVGGKDVETEEKPQIKSKLRRSSRTSRGCIEVHKNELENSELCKIESDKTQEHKNEPKSNEVNDKGTISTEVSSTDLKSETNLNKNIAGDVSCDNLNEADDSKRKNAEEEKEENECKESKRRKTETKSSRRSARRSRNSRRSARNTRKSNISSEKCITITLDEDPILNPEVNCIESVLPVSHTSLEIDKTKTKFTPLIKDSEIICGTEDMSCGIYVSNMCLETKTKYKADIKVINNKHFKNKVKESFSKSLMGENAVCCDHEEAFSVGRIRTRGRLKRECSVTVPPPPKQPPAKSKKAPPSQSKSPSSSTGKGAQNSQTKPPAKGKATPLPANKSPATPRKRIRGKRIAQSKTPLPDGILEIIGNTEEKNISKNDKVKKSSDKKSNEILSCTFPMADSDNESTPVKRSRRIQEQNQKKISQLAVEMEQEQRRLEKLAKQNAAVAKNKQKEAIEKTQKPQPTHQQQQQQQPPPRSNKRASKNEVKQLEQSSLVEVKNGPRKTRNRSRNLTKMALMYEDDSKDLEYETSRDTVKSRRRRNGRRGRKKKYKPWDLSSESSSPSEEITEEEEEEEQEELLVFNTNEDEFACEEIDESAEPVVIRRARTAKKAKSASESEGETDIIPDDKPCARCGEYDEPEWILLCDKCDSGYHTRCLVPVLMIIPDGDWFCPPCEHTFLVENLLAELHKLEQMLKQREREELRKQRLAYVGISLDNVLKPEKKEKQENESFEEEDESEESSEEDRIYSKRSSRIRRVVNYQFKEFDELIQSAIEEEMVEFKLPEKTEAPVDSNEDSEADVVAPSRRKKKPHRLNDLDFTDVDDSDEEYKGSSLSETEVSQSAQSEGSNSRHSGSSASWQGNRKTRSSGQKKHHKKKRSRHSGESDYMDGESFRPTTRRAAQKKISYRELSSDEEWGDDKPASKKRNKRKPSSNSSESSDESFKKRKSKKKARIVQKWKKSDSDSESEPRNRKSRSDIEKWEESDSESESKEVRKKSHTRQRWEDSESGSDSGSRRVKKTRTVQKWGRSDSESESDSKKSSSSESETSGTSVQSTEKWKIKKSSEGNGIKININRKVLDSDSDSTSGQAKLKKKSVSRIVDSEDSEESDEDDDGSKKVSDEESTSESNAAHKVVYKDEKTESVKNVPSSAIKDVKCGPEITVTAAAEKVVETAAEQAPPPKPAQHQTGIHLKEKVPPSMQKVVKCVKPLARSLMKSDSVHKNFDSSISETFSNDSQSLQGLPTEHEEPMCESDSEPDPKLNRFSNDQYICKTEIFEKDSVYRPAKEDQSFNYNAAEEKSYQIPYTGLASLQDYPSRPSPLKPSMVETYSNSTSPSKLTPLDSYSEASSPKGFISLDACSSFRKSGTFVNSDPETKSRPILTSSDNYQGEIRFPQEQYPPYERPSHLSPAPCPSSPAAFPQSPSARENASPPRMYSQYPEPYAGQRSPEYYHGQQYYGREEGVPRQNYVLNYSSSENASPYPYNTNSSQQPNGGFMIDTLLRSRNPEGEEDELTGVTDIVSYITQE